MSRPADPQAPAAPSPYIREELDARSLHFSMSAIQSRMSLARPDALTLEYTRLVMGWLLLRPEASRLCMIGLGGGSIAKFCHRHLPRTSMCVVEIDPRVIALRHAFQVPADDARLRIVEADGARFIAQTAEAAGTAGTAERFDVLIVDAFDVDGLPPALGTQRFYDDCVDVLAPGGLFVANLHTGHPDRALHLERIGRAFEQRTLLVEDRDGTNSVVFAARSGESSAAARSGGAVWPAGGRTLHKPAALADAPWRELRGAFSRIASTWERERARRAEAGPGA